MTTPDIAEARRLAAQFRSHPVSRSIDEIEAGGELLYAMADELERLRAQVAPAGWKLVPVDPTNEMLAAGGDFLCNHTTEFLASLWEQAESCYRAMLAASPAAPAQQAEPLTFNGASFVQHVQTVADGGHSWADEWLTWYSPGEWLSEERACAAFLGIKLAAPKIGLLERIVDGATPSEGGLTASLRAVAADALAQQAGQASAPAPDHLELFKEAGEWAEAMKRKITPDMIELLGWLTGAANAWAEKVEAEAKTSAPAVTQQLIGYLSRHRADVAEALKFEPGREPVYLWRFIWGAEDIEAMERCEHLEVIRIYRNSDVPVHTKEPTHD